MSKEDIILRISTLINESGLSKNKFAEKCNINQANLSQMLLGKRTIGDAIINKIVMAFEINKDWLLTGEGEKFKSTYSQEATVITNPNILMVPLVGQYAYAGYLSGFADPEYIETLPKMPVYVDHEAKGDYINFEVKGDSMDDGSTNSICDRDIITCRSVNSDLWKSKLHINKWYFVIVHKTDGILVKKIVDHNIEKGSITIHSLNPDKTQYPDRVFNLNEVAMLFNVIKVTREMKI